jgi:hypothetical protein
MSLLLVCDEHMMSMQTCSVVLRGSHLGAPWLKISVSPHFAVFETLESRAVLMAQNSAIRPSRFL